MQKLSFQTREGFWREAFALHGSITPKIIPFVLTFGLTATGICGVSWLIEKTFQVQIALAVAPFELAGAALGLLLVLRTNVGYDRWWEARTLWGGISRVGRAMPDATRLPLIDIHDARPADERTPAAGEARPTLGPHDIRSRGQSSPGTSDISTGELPGHFGSSQPIRTCR